MKYFYVISNLSKDYVLDVQDEVQVLAWKKEGLYALYDRL